MSSSYHMNLWCCLFGEDVVVGGVGDLYSSRLLGDLYTTFLKFIPTI